MTYGTPTIRSLRRSDFPALEELIRLAWYDDGGDLRNMHRLAAIDMQDCLARATKAYVAELDGQVLGVILGSLRVDITHSQRIRHIVRRNCLALPLLASRQGRRGLRAQLAILQVDEALKHDTGKNYGAEVVLFIVSPVARGMGIGRTLFEHMLGVFHDAGLREYFLFTDSTCDVGYYDHRGLIRKAERGKRVDDPQSGADAGGSTCDSTDSLLNGEPISYFLYEGRC